MSKNNEMEAFAAGIRMARAARRWTQPRLATAAELSVPTIIKVEAARPVTVDTLLAIAGALGMTFREVMKLGDATRRS